MFSSIAIPTSSILSYNNNPIYNSDLLKNISFFCSEEDKIRMCISNREISNIIKTLSIILSVK